MTPEKTHLLFERHKHMFRGKNLSIRENLMPFGFECGDGWYILIDELCSEIERIIDNDEVLKEDFIVTQVKEKFGTLRFYCGPGSEAIYAVINLAESLSQHICESCGSPGRTNHTGWLRTLCPICKNRSEN